MPRQTDESATNPDATRPTELRKGDVKTALLRVKTEIKNDNLALLAGGVAFYAFLSIFPALTAIVSIYGLFADPADVEQQLRSVSGVLPDQASGVIEGQLGRITETSPSALGWTAVLSILLALWSANKATKGLFKSLSVVYDANEERGFVKLNAESLAMTIGLTAAAVVAIALVAVFPAVSELLGLGKAGELAASLARWPVLIAVVLLALAVLYNFAPDRERTRWRWTTPGALVATALWLLASIGFSLYVRYFGSFNETYGVLGAVVILMLWLYISAYVVLMGGELNNELERRTKQDTTVGETPPWRRQPQHVAPRAT